MALLPVVLLCGLNGAASGLSVGSAGGLRAGCLGLNTKGAASGLNLDVSDVKEGNWGLCAV